ARFAPLPRHHVGERTGEETGAVVFVAPDHDDLTGVPARPGCQVDRDPVAAAVAAENQPAGGADEGLGGSARRGAGSFLCRVSPGEQTGGRCGQVQFVEWQGMAADRGRDPLRRFPVMTPVLWPRPRYPVERLQLCGEEDAETVFG